MTCPWITPPCTHQRGSPLRAGGLQWSGGPPGEPFSAVLQNAGADTAGTNEEQEGRRRCFQVWQETARRVNRVQVAGALSSQTGTPNAPALPSGHRKPPRKTWA